MLFVADAHTTYQAGLNVEQVAREGYSALVVKATEGAAGYTAPGAFDDWVRRARAAGMIPGAYHWLTSANAGQQLDHFLGRIGSPAGLICAVDVEQDSGAIPAFATLAAFVAGWQQRTGGHPLVLYSSNWWWSKHQMPVGAGLTPYLWDSRYVTGSGYGSVLLGKVPASWWTPKYGGWPRATLLQYSSSALIDGRKMDTSAFEGDMGDLARLAGLEGGPMKAELSWGEPGWGRGDLVGGRPDGVLLGEIWTMLFHGLGLYQHVGDESSAFAPAILQQISTGIAALLAAQDAEIARDAQAATRIQSMATAIDTLVSAVNAGGTGTPLDAAAIMARIESAVSQVAENTHAQFMALMEHHRAAMEAALDQFPAAVGDTEQP
jgi:hypothetical protein